MKYYTDYETGILHSFKDYFLSKYAPHLYKEDYGKFLDLVCEMFNETFTEFINERVEEVKVGTSH